MSINEVQRILLLDRHAGRDRLRASLRGSGFAVVTCTTCREALAILGDGFVPQALVLGQPGDCDAVAALAAIGKVSPDLPLVVLGDGEAAAPPQDSSVCYLDRAHAAERLDAALIGQLRERQAGLAAAGDQGDGLIAVSPAMIAIRDLLVQIADTDVAVLITGESGVGKEVVARTLHRHSDRAAGPFVKVNCAALPDQLLESELFGYERGAFTGAERNKPGKFELAHGGTIFLDEIGEVSAGTQAKLLQVLQDGCYFRLGGDREISVDARVVASTNRDLEGEMAAGSFRKDLFYRLNVVRIEVPPLAERREEIPPLVRHFVRRYEGEYGRHVGELSEEMLDRLMRHDWPGNVRQLENVVRRIVVMEDVESVVNSLERRHAPAAASPGVDLGALLGPDGELPPLKEVSRIAALEIEGELIRLALERTKWNRRQAARLLDISYKALLYKIRDCGIVAA